MTNRTKVRVVACTKNIADSVLAEEKRKQAEREDEHKKEAESHSVKIKQMKEQKKIRDDKRRLEESLTANRKKH
jgi:hypothetical protein